MEAIVKQNILAFGAKREKGQYKPATVKLYMTNLVNFHRMIQPDLPFDSLEWSRDVQFVTNILQKEPNLQTKRNYLNALITALQTMEFDTDVIGKYMVYRAKWKNDYDQAGYLTPNQKRVMDKVKKDDILKFLNRESIGVNGQRLQSNLKEYQMWLVLSIHTRYPFRNELGEMRLIRRKVFDALPEDQEEEGKPYQKENNWYVLETGWTKASFVLTKYKTEGAYGIKTFPVEDKFCRFVHKLFQIKGKKLADINHEPLLSWGNGSGISRTQLSTILTAYTTEKLGASISTTLLAKYFSTSAADPANPTDEEVERMKEEADIRGHSLATKFSVYSA
jgi:hypothetical protein